MPDAEDEERDVLDVFIWSKGKVTIRHAGAPFFSEAQDVNSSGVVVGTASDFQDEFDFSDAFVIEGGVVTVLDQIGAGSQRMLGGAEAINAAGDIVGFRGPFVPDVGFVTLKATLWRRQR